MQNQKLQLLLSESQRMDRLTDYEYSDPGSPVSPASATFETSSCSLMEAAATVLLTSQRAKQQQDLMERSRQISSDWLWDWTVGSGCGSGASGHSGCEWRSSLMQSRHEKKQLSLRQWAIRHGLFSKQILSLFLLSNIVSVLLGGGIVYSFLVRRSSV